MCIPPRRARGYDDGHDDRDGAVRPQVGDGMVPAPAQALELLERHIRDPFRLARGGIAGEALRRHAGKAALDGTGAEG